MSDPARAHLVYAFRKVLRPLVKILIRAGVRYDEFIEVLKGVYVETAIRDGLSRPGPVTRSRVALVTGVTRRDVDRYVDDESLLAPPPPTHATVLIEVLHLWNTDPRYLGPYGVPLEVDFDSTPGRCFTDLVAIIDEKADPGLVLEDLRRSGSVVSSGERYLKVTSRSYVIGDMMSPQALEYFGNTIASLARTLEHNMGGQTESRRLQRSVIADRGMPMELMPEFEIYVKSRVQLMLSDVDDWIGQNITKWGLDEASSLPTGVTVFHYVDQSADDERSLPDCLGENS